MQNDLVIALDIGAAGSIPEHWLKYKHWLDCIAFDEGDRKVEQENGVAKSSLPILLGKDCKHRKFYVLKSETGSSLLPLNPKFQDFFHSEYHTLKEIKEVSTVSLNTLVTEKRLPYPELIKLDTQGSELEILNNAELVLSRLIICELEVEFLEIYQGQALFSDINNFFDRLEFELIDLRTARISYSRNGVKNYFVKQLGLSAAKLFSTTQIYSGEALYCRSVEWILSQDHSDFVKALKILIIYRCFDRALYIIDKAQARNLFSSQEIIDFRNLVYMNIPWFRGTSLLVRASRKLIRLLSLPGTILSKVRCGWLLRDWPNS
ncbi:MAG: FkbM family methyltransferase [Spirulina sp. SIO3F2]|nr:FkbM family methyltransferase [Spirulina sp. SIO3F2]